jgi:hypothetical protein
MVATEALVYWSMRFEGSVTGSDGQSKLKASPIPESLALEIDSINGNFYTSLYKIKTYFVLNL